MLEFKREKVQATFAELPPLLEIHYKEISHYPDIALDPDWDQYAAVEEAGALRTFTIRTEEKELVGYAIYFVRKNIHYKSSLQAVQDIIFLHPKYRGRGAKFIKWCDEQLKAEGVQVVYHHVKEKHNFGPLLERQGYELIDLIYGKRLDKWE